MAPTDGNLRLLHFYDEISRALGTGSVEATDPRAAGAADIAFAAESVPMALDGIGLMGKDDHTDRETADLATLASQTKRAALLLYRLSKGITNDE
jgi:glutamate carboxypeptidase